MADFVYNVAKGRVAELHNRVKTNDPANSALIVVVVDVGATTDATLKDFATLAAVLGGGATERATNGWTRKTLDDTVVAALAPDNTNDWNTVDAPDQTWTAVAGAGGNSTDLLVCYDGDTTGGTDANIIPLVQLDFPITADGSNVVWQLDPLGYFKAV